MPSALGTLVLRLGRFPVEQEISARVKELPGSSEKVNVMVAVSPALRVERLLVIVTVGGRVS